MKKNALINELAAIRSQALDMAARATVLIQQAGDQAPASLKNADLKKVIDRRNSKIFNKKAGSL